ncbi:cysteine desulfurase family protein [Patescibacteria group bacterium]
MSQNIIYLDHAATTPVDPEVFAAMEPFLKEEFGNPSSLYTLGHDARKAVDDARAVVARVLNCSAQEVVFTNGGTESANLAVFGVARQAGQGKVVTSAIEHPAVLEPCQALEQEGFEVEVVGVEKNGIIDVSKLADVVDDATILVSLMAANNEIGTIQPVAEAVAAVKEKNSQTVFHSDACQASGALELDVKKSGVDLLTINASKIYGPKGIGALYVKQGLKLKPLMYGGGQERGLCPGTENVAGIVGLAKALELADARQEQESARLTALRDKLTKGILNTIPDTELNGDAKQRLPNNVNILIKNIDGQALLFNLDQQGIQASLGSACATGATEPSHVIMALGRSGAEAHSSLRLTLGKDTTEAEIDQVLESLPTIIQKLRGLK